MKNIKLAKELLKIAKELTSGLLKEEQIEEIYNEQAVDKEMLHKIWDEYTDEISKDIQAGVRRHSRIVSVISLKQWLINNNYENWTYGKKYDDLFVFNKNELEQAGYEFVKQDNNVYFISIQKLCKKVEEKIKSNRNFKGSLPTMQDFEKIYLENQH